ncbi:xyloglucan endotransglucosylase/hydrolase-like [Dendrobium catenatum]|uniref:xyloglucan endotransglucosylase/hydrolase-like n=1 Tax=Dendrobium catenatum TaxID=906689 RepID=UPI0010A06DF1|nr:xyloglucan endotransglucosylase/hydrolase-like [Dendrobium catenatum]
MIELVAKRPLPRCLLARLRLAWVTPFGPAACAQIHEHGPIVIVVALALRILIMLMVLAGWRLISLSICKQAQVNRKPNHQLPHTCSTKCLSEQTNHRFFVDDVPIRVFKNSKDIGVRYPFNQPMKLYSSLWNADDWATRGGLEKTNWANAPFIAAYRGFHIDGCEASTNETFCATQGRRWWDQNEFRNLDAKQYDRLRWVRERYTIYNYCTDRSRYPTMPAECQRDRDV